MGETSVGHLGILGHIVFRRSIALRAIPFVATIWIVAAASCAVPPPTPTPTGGPPRIPHSLEGREGRCLLCHEQGVAGAPRVTAAHLGRTNDMCTLCHTQAAAPAHSSGTLATEAVAPAAVPAPATPTPAAGPASTPAAAGGGLEAGKAVFNQFCAVCHPGGGKGVGPALRKADYQGSKEETTKTVRQGRGAMPAFAATQMTDQQLADIVAYLDSLQ